MYIFSQQYSARVNLIIIEKKNNVNNLNNQTVNFEQKLKRIF